VQARSGLPGRQAYQPGLEVVQFVEVEEALIGRACHPLHRNLTVVPAATGIDAEGGRGGFAALDGLQHLEVFVVELRSTAVGLRKRKRFVTPRRAGRCEELT
jgi:hypothetical protein